MGLGEDTSFVELANLCEALEGARLCELEMIKILLMQILLVS